MGIDEAVALLGDIDLFADFSREQLRLLAFVAEDTTLERGAVLYTAGDPANGAYVLVSGVLVASEDPAARGAYRVRPTALVGEFGLMLTRPRGMTMTADGPAKLLFVPREAFLKLLRNEPELAGQVAARLRRQLAHYLDAVTRAGARFSGE